MFKKLNNFFLRLAGVIPQKLKMTDQSTAKLTAPDFKKQNNRALTAFDYDTGEVVTLYLKSASGILMNGYAFGSSNPKDTHLTQGDIHELRAGAKVSRSQPDFLGARVAHGSHKTSNSRKKIASEARDFFHEKHLHIAQLFSQSPIKFYAPVHSSWVSLLL